MTYASGIRAVQSAVDDLRGAVDDPATEAGVRAFAAASASAMRADVDKLSTALWGIEMKARGLA